jgi:MucR family transcriptional regulator, transcriptional regulator of exopolysaccharide biosynthesis
MAKSETIALVAEIVRGYVSHNSIAADDLPNLIATVHRSFAELGQPAEAAGSRKPAVAINRSYGRNFVVCLECGRRGMTLRRHLTAAHSLSPRDYRARWNLRHTHPLIAPAYSERRSSVAQQIGLGQIRRTRAVTPEPPAPTPERRGRRRRTAPAPTTP